MSSEELRSEWKGEYGGRGRRRDRLFLKEVMLRLRVWNEFLLSKKLFLFNF